MVRLYTDGACSGNPGPAAAAWLVVDGGEVLLEGGEHLGEVTSNAAEHTAIIRGLEACVERGFREVEVLSDSQLVVRQVKGEYRVREARLRPLHDEVMRLNRGFGRVEFRWVGRDNGWTARCDEWAMGILRGAGQA